MNTKLITAFFLIAALLLASCTSQVTVNNQPERDKLSISGQGEVRVDPNKAELTIAFYTNASTAKEAQDRNKQISNSVLDSLKAMGVKKEDIETISYDLQKFYDWNPKTGERVDKGYELTHSVKVTTTNLDSVGTLVDTVVASGGNRVDGVAYGLTPEAEKAAKDQALAKAGKVATDKAASMARTIGLNLGKIIQASENTNYQPYYPPMAKYMSGRGAEDMIAASAPTQITPGKLTVTAYVNLDYELK